MPSCPRCERAGRRATGPCRPNWRGRGRATWTSWRWTARPWTRWWLDVLTALPAGALLVFDLGWTNFRHFADLTQARISL